LRSMGKKARTQFSELVGPSGYPLHYD
jgi:hypothetical protein